MREQSKIKQAPVKFNETQFLIKKLEEKLGMPMIVYWNSYNGGVCQNDVTMPFTIFLNRLEVKRKSLCSFVLQVVIHWQDCESSMLFAIMPNM
ncbi:hypothetical protein [Enterococcus olivae]